MTLEEIFDPSPGWRESAACVGTDADLFFPIGDTDIETVAAAKAVCAGCPVRDDCLAYAIETNQTDGIWGGLTAAERRRLRRRWLRQLRKAS